MKISKFLTDEAVLAELGERLTRQRLNMQLTQAAVAQQAGIAKRTLERMEAGHSSQLSSLIRVMRVLDAMPGLEGLLADSGPSPMDQLRRRAYADGKPRQRASTKQQTGDTSEPWSWDDR